MTPERLKEITSRYAGLKVAIVGDFCLDRYFEIDPTKAEISIETGLVVHNVMNVRNQPGGAGTILNNLVALGVHKIYPVAFAGEDGEGYELHRALSKKPGVVLDHFVTTPLRRTFTYAKPLILAAGKPPQELNRLDQKNWDLTPFELEQRFITAMVELASKVDAFILLDQVDLPGTGVITNGLLQAVDELTKRYPKLQIMADSRTGLKQYPPVIFKMNRAELAALHGSTSEGHTLDAVKASAVQLARKNNRMVFITLAEDGLLGATNDGEVFHHPALPLRGEIDIVGAGDAVSANLTTALASGASCAEALELAAVAASLVIHQLGTTGTASVSELMELHNAKL